MTLSIAARLAEDLAVREAQVAATIALLDGGSTVPFVARYRKEATGGLDDIQLRRLDERLRYLRELDERRATVLESIREQGKLTDALAQAIDEADSKARLEDLYLPFKPKRRTKAQIAREAGLEPLADALLGDPGKTPETEAAAFVVPTHDDPGRVVPDVKAALDGARQILMERFAEDPELSGRLRELLWDQGLLRSTLIDGKAEAGAKFSDYFDHAEPIRKIPSHRALALFRGRNEGVLSLTLELPDAAETTGPGPCEQRIAGHFSIRDQGRPADRWLMECVRWSWKVRLAVRLEIDLMARLWAAAEDEAIAVFAANLRDLLLAAPAGGRATLALDPGFRTGVKVAVVSATGRVVETATIYPHEPQKRWDQSLAVLATLCRTHTVELIAIGNGTAARETDKLAAELLRQHPDLKLTKAMVSEAGASVYSASELASREMPDLDVSLRGAVSIGRRLQDPLAELVKIDPKSIGVGQYQHDLSEAKLSRSLDAVVEDCVNAVGVDLNTASPALLARVSGLSAALADNVVAHRDAGGRFRTRKDLLAVPRLGPKAFEQAAGFLRIQGGDDPLDASAVHPEAYPVVRRILAALGKPLAAVMGQPGALSTLDPAAFTDDSFGLPTVTDILKELEKPGRDPRPEFRTASFQDGVETLADLKPGMVLEGVVTNCTNFGAFVDIGVHQDGLVHVSAMADRFISNPRDVVKPGDVVRVKVQEVDLKRRRIALTMRLTDPAAPAKGGDAADAPAGRPRGQRGQGGQGGKPGGGGRVGGKGRGGGAAPAAPTGALAEAFQRARDKG